MGRDNGGVKYLRMPLRGFRSVSFVENNIAINDVAKEVENENAEYCYNF
jgi:hypothetical protein